MNIVKKIINKLKVFSKSVKKEILIYRLVMKDERTPVAAKFLLWLAVGYFLLPFDIIPDFIPLAGQLDDIVIIPVLLYFAIKLLPDGIVDEYRNAVN